jgi:hypothetical protein
MSPAAGHLVNSSPGDAAAPVRRYSAIAAFLSLVVPGLGQIYQGRVAKGALFLICIPGMFFVGMALGNWKNVFLPPANGWPGNPLPRVTLGNVRVEGPLKALYYRIQYAGQFWVGAAAWPALLQYVAYDPDKDSMPVFGGFERTPSETELNDLQRNSDKRWDLGWVYTVIAGVLNVLVIYDAYAGPLFLTGGPNEPEEPDSEKD